MARPDATGSAYGPKRGKFYLSVSVGASKRQTEHVPSATCLEDARERSRVASSLVAQLREAEQVEWIEKTVEQVAIATTTELEEIRAVVAQIVSGTWPGGKKPKPSIGGPTFLHVARALTSGELHRDYPDFVDSVSPATLADYVHKLDAYILPTVRDVPLVAFTLDHALDVMRKVPKTRSASSRRTIAFLMHRVLALAVFPLRHLKANPLPRGFLPKLGAPRARGLLLPTEDAMLMRGALKQGSTDEANAKQERSKPEALPLVRRLLFGLLAREGMRKEEAAGLQWSDTREPDADAWIDLDRGWVYLETHKTVDTSGARDWPLDAGVADALRMWRTMQPAGARFVFSEDGSAAPNVEHIADALRTDLLAVGVDRPELHATTKARRQINAHDLRGTFVTLALAQGRAEGWIRRRTGHTTSEMIERYRRNAANLAEGTSAQLAPLVEAIPELAEMHALARAERRRALLAFGAVLAEIGAVASMSPQDANGREPSTRATESRPLAAPRGPLPSSGSSAFTGVGVQVPPFAPTENHDGFGDGANAIVNAKPEAATGQSEDVSPARAPLASAVAALTAEMNRALEVGDVSTARRLQSAIGVLLDGASDARTENVQGASVIELDAQRARRR